MRRFFTFVFALCLISTSIYAQQTRKVLWEQFTNTGCGPCAGFNPTAETYWAANPDKVVPISFHVSWPAGNDPMYMNNTAENNWRRLYYGCNSVPWTTLNGNVYNNNPNGIANLSTLIDNELEEAPKFDVEIEHQLNSDNSEVTVNVTVTANEAMSGDFLTHIVILEKEINLETPAPNNETHFVNVMKKFLPGQEGNALPTSIAAGESFSFNHTWTVEGFYDILNLCAAAFVQNTTNKYVYQAAFSSPIAPTYNDVAASAFAKPTNLYCGEGITPILTITNKGADLNSVDVEYSINGSEPMTYHITEDIAFLSSADIELPFIADDFLHIGTNTLSATLINPNGGEDNNPDDNSTNISFDMLSVNNDVVVKIFTGSYAEELSWELIDYNGNIIKEKAYDTDDSQQTYWDTLTFPITGCYSMVWHDSYGDGFNGNGYCTLFTNEGVELTSFNSFTTETSLHWYADGSTQLNSPTNLTAEIISGSNIRLAWEAPTTKTTLLGFNIWLGAEATTTFNSELIPADQLNLEYHPNENGHFDFYISAVYEEGESARTGPASVDFFDHIQEYTSNLNLHAYPNPTEDILNIQFNLPGSSQVEISLSDLSGKSMLNITSATLVAGQHKTTINTAQLPEGIYFLQINANGNTKVQKVVKL